MDTPVTVADGPPETTGPTGVARAAAVCAVVGGLGYLVVGFAHGDLPSHSVEHTLAHVAGQPAWPAIHLTGIVAVLLWAGAIGGLAAVLPAGRAAVLGRAATLAAVFGAALFTVDYSIDGVALKLAADAWASAPDPTAALAARDIGAAVVAVLGGTVTAGTTWAFGPPVLLAGLALQAERRVAGPLAWFPVLTGSVTLVAGLVTYVVPGNETSFLIVLAASAASALWLIALGVTLWRRDTRPR